MNRLPIPDLDSPDTVASYDELPLWSAPFGLKLLETVRLRPGLHALDVGCGAGFPFLELAERIGPQGHVTGLDLWKSAMDRVAAKIRARGIRNATPVIGAAEQMPFSDASFDLIVSNNGINNVADPAAAMTECARVARSGAQLVITVNLPGTMVEFYDAFRNVLKSMGRGAQCNAIDAHIDVRRKPTEWTIALVERAGFAVEKADEDSFAMVFADGTALFHDWFIRLAFLGPWRDIVGESEFDEVFTRLEAELNRSSAVSGGLRLTVPFLCLSATCRG